MNNIAGALHRVIKIKKRNEVQPENEVSVTPVSVQTAMSSMSEPMSDVGIGLLSPLSHKPWYVEFYVGKIRRIRICRCSEAWF